MAYAGFYQWQSWSLRLVVFYFFWISNFSCIAEEILSSPADALHVENVLKIQSKDVEQTKSVNSEGSEKQLESKKADSSEAKWLKTPDAIKPRLFLLERKGFDISEAPLIDDQGHELSDAILSSLRTAQIHLKLATAEFGNIAEFNLAIESLNVAIRNSANHKAPDAATASKVLEALKKEVISERDSSRATFFGRFPLVRGFSLWPETDEQFQVRSYYEKEEAYRLAVFFALSQIAKAASHDRVHVLLMVPGETVEMRRSNPLAKIVDSQGHQAFTNNAGFNVHLGDLRTEFDPQPSWDSPDPAFDPICRQFLNRIGPAKESHSIMLVMIREFSDEKKNGNWIQVQQRTYEPHSLEKAENKPTALEADSVKVFEAITRDRSGIVYLLVGGIIGLFVMALLSHRCLSHIDHIAPDGWQRGLATPIAGFVIGFGLTPLVMLALRRWMPAPISSALSAAWWPSTAGALSLILPAGVFRLILGTVGRYLPSMSCHGRWGHAFVPVGFGICAAWFCPALVSVDRGVFLFVSCMAIAACSILYCFGRAVDIADEFPVALTPFVICMCLVFGIGAFSGSSSVLIIAIAMAATAISAQILLQRRSTQLAAQAIQDLIVPELNLKAPRTVEQLKLALNSPKYLQPRALKRFRSSIDQIPLESTRWIGVTGPAAAGKSKAAQFLIDEIDIKEFERQILSGYCVENSTPYHPFRDALSELGASAGLLACGSAAGEVNTIFERLADEFIPFWDLVSVDSDDDSKEMSRHDLLEGVISTLKKLMRSKNVILLLEDIQWIDEGSLALLKELRESFPPLGKFPLTVILTSREASALTEFDLNEAIFALEPATQGEQVYFLQSSLGIDQSSAKHLVNALGVMSQETGSIFWLIRAVRQLVEEDAFVPSPYGLRLRSSYIKSNQLPVPAEMRAKLGALLRSSGQYRPILECAALIGQKFRIDDVAQCLGMDRLLMLQVLRHLEQELHLVRDVVSDNECYEFSSEFMLQIVREELGVGESRVHGTGDSSKIAKELHARIAAVIQRRTPRTPQLIYDLSRHYSSAGLGYAQQCVDSCLAASDTARKQFAFHTARSYLEMAEKSARILRRQHEILEKRKLINGDEQRAFMTKQNSARAA